MYDYFNGKITSLQPTQVTVECNGVGYQLQISLYTFTALKDQQQGRVYAHLVVREDAHLLFGFSDEEERYMFRELLNVSGVGASTARIILSSLPSSELRSVIASGEANRLQKVKGIGTKTAQRIILDLQDKMRKGNVSGMVLPVGVHNTIQDEALSALLTLGFVRASAEKAIQQAQRNSGANPGVEELIKGALSYL